MNKKKFLKKLERLLRRLPEEEREAALRYYREYFDEAGIENEQRVIEELGSPEKVAEEILQGSSSNVGDTSVPARKGPNAALVVLVVLLAIVEICLLIGFCAADIAILGIGFVLVLNIVGNIALLTIVTGGILVALAITLVFTALTIWAIRTTFRLTRSDTEERRN